MTEQEKAQQEYQRQMNEHMRRQQQAQQEAMAQAMQAQRRAQESQQMMDNEPRQKYAVIAAVDQHRGFSKNGEIPWHYPEDFKWFVQRTTEQICVMGRTTYEDINKRLGEKAVNSVLPNRRCFVVSSTLKQDDVKNATVIQHCGDAVNYLSESERDKTIFFIGGERIFKEGIALANTVYLTVINKEFGCDKYFPTEYVEKYFNISSVHKSETEPDLRFLTCTRR